MTEDGCPIYILVYDYGCEGFQIHGVVTSEREAKIWACNTSHNYLVGKLNEVLPTNLMLEKK